MLYLHCLDYEYSVGVDQNFRLNGLDASKYAYPIHNLNPAQQMSQPLFPINFSSSNTFYSCRPDYQLWAHLHSTGLTLQCRTYPAQSHPRTYTKNIKNSPAFGPPALILQSLMERNDCYVDSKRGTITVDMGDIGHKTGKHEIRLQEIKSGPNLDNWMLMHLMNENMQKIHNANAGNSGDDGSESVIEDDQAGPIIHENQHYRFEARLDPQIKQIITELTVKNSNHANKGKVYRSVIKEKDWAPEYYQRFSNIQALFEHLADPNNYQVLQRKGVIRIKNDPSEVSFPKATRTERPLRSASKLGAPKPQRQRRVSLDAGNNFQLGRQLDEMSKKIETEVLRKFKQTQLQTVAKQKEEESKYLQKMVEVERTLKIFIQQQISQEVQKLKKLMIGTINQIKHSEMTHLKQRSNLNVHVPVSLPDKQLKKNLQILKKPMEVNANSRQLGKFKINENCLVQYEGAWDWTQLFTSLQLKFDKTYIIQFKLLKSDYNAVALGVSSSKNIDEKSSLSKPGSCSYWGDGEVWQAHKIKDEGRGFKTNETVSMHINRQRGQISWHVNDQLRAKHQPDFLRDQSLSLFAYIEMYDSGDVVKLLSYQAL